MASALKVIEGIQGQTNTNSDAVSRFKKINRKKWQVDDYTEGILRGDITTLSKAITLVESSRDEQQEMAQQIIEKVLSYSGNSIRIGITGVPGVGKSTFIESLGNYITQKGHKLAVLAVDPSSSKSKGSILGDKTRMEKLSVNKNAFIRPSPSSGTLGGVARKTRESIILCEAAGFDTIFIETVGVGQSETAVYSMVDFFLLLMLAGAGDELQGIKRGIMEMADAIVITKADGDNIARTSIAQAEYKAALHLFPPAESGWLTKVLTCSAKTNKNIDQIWTIIEDYKNFTDKNLYIDKKRKEQTKFWMYETIHENLMNSFYQSREVEENLMKTEKDVTHNQLSPFQAASRLLKLYFRSH